jgi:small subunit ribosomal protein S17
MIERARKKTATGLVVSSAMDKTVTVKVERVVQHPRYKKYVKRFTSYKAHDEENEAKVGDLVAIVESRPMSKTKRWAVKEIIKKAAEVLYTHDPDANNPGRCRQLGSQESRVYQGVGRLPEAIRIARRHHRCLGKRCRP